MSYATDVDIADRLGRDLEPDEARIVAARLEDVEALIKTRIPDLDQKVQDGSLNQRLVVMVEADVLLRLIKNPEGYTQETDGNYSYSVDSRVSSGRLSILTEEWTMLGVQRPITIISPYISITACRCEGAYCNGACNPNADFESGIHYGSDLNTAGWG